MGKQALAGIGRTHILTRFSNFGPKCDARSTAINPNKPGTI